MDAINIYNREKYICAEGGMGAMCVCDFCVDKVIKETNYVKIL